MTRAPLLLALLTLATPAVAQTHGGASFAKEFAATDANKDGILTRAEVAARMRHMKVAGRGELDATHAKRVADLWFANADTNKDGKVTRAEGQALLDKTVAAYKAAHAQEAKAGPAQTR